MGQFMNINNTAGDDTSRRVIEEIAFQASMLALHAAIESACKGGSPSASSPQPEGQISGTVDDQVLRLVEIARRPAGNSDASGRPYLRGF